MVCEDSTTQTIQTGDVYKRKPEVLEFIKAAERGMRELPQDKVRLPRL